MLWYYFYTNDYFFWDVHLKSKLNKYFDLYPLQIDNINISNIGKHQFNGVTIKMELIIDCILKNFGKTIIFSDCTLFINKKNVKKLYKYINNPIFNDYDLVFPQETLPLKQNVNICLMIIKCNDETLNFFKKTIELINSKKINWDQECVNYLLINNEFNNLKWTTFDKYLMICNYILENKYKNSYFIYKQYIYNINKEFNWNIRLELLYSNDLLSYNDYNNNIIKKYKYIYPLYQYIIYNFVIKYNKIIHHIIYYIVPYKDKIILLILLILIILILYKKLIKLII